MQLRGVITALATPFAATGELDMPAWERLLKSQVAAGIAGVVVAGSTGEANALSDAEYGQLIESAVTHAGSMQVIAGTGLPNTAKTIQMTRLAKSHGAQAALVVTPAYVRPTQAGLIAHYRAVADEGGLPVILYNVPGRTGTDMQPETVAELSTHANVIGVKEAVDAPARMDALLALKSPDFAVLSGDDPTVAHACQAGADGLVSVGSNIAPRTFVRLVDLAMAGNPAANDLDEQMRGLYAFLSAEPNPIPVKALLAKFGYGHGLRLPLTELSAAHSGGLDDIAKVIVALESSSS
ncbi:4-hydroxy-tetrahydrodipicolinate synthase [Lysobacter soyae]|uniref:4-hydroxy-tetrahydrodipicolinate synthase n=1 Tax=Lysobacter soyae TaxID=2764185 RepID=A0ABX8WKT4_9GAMM|nr:4-hydroxy-tetrahydrodipicolinate synthase [Lysobacter sp. CJ11]QYR52034.1 4-hydroxy-tetrahydrodipicolinate synthase [Lysobacter sp. CJ11]